MITKVQHWLVIATFTFIGSIFAIQPATSESLLMSIGKATVKVVEKPFLRSQYQLFPKTLRIRFESFVFNETIFLQRLDVSIPVVYRGPGSSYTRNESVNCHYNPNVTGVFSFCREIKGFLHFPKSTVHIEFLNTSVTKGLSVNSANNIYLVNVTKVPRNVENVEFRPFRRKRSIHFSPFAPYVVNLFVVTDSSLLYQFEQNTRRLISRVVNIMNIVNTAFRPFNVTLAVVGLEIWSRDEKFINKNNPEGILHMLKAYKAKRHLGAHCTHMLIGQMRTAPKGEPIGRAKINTMCSTDSCVGFSLDSKLKTDFETALVVAHELGHNFGMKHDRQDTDCQTCIMSPSMEYARLDLTWSQRSMETMRDIIDQGLGRCLKDQPQSLDAKMQSRCGNGIVESGEECDCGTRVSCIRTRCCDKCKLRAGAQCATGACCDHNTCRLKSRSFQCRALKGPCDLPEFCDGQTEYCPRDRVKRNGVACYNSGEAYCYNGDCQTRQSWCQVLWGSTGRAGSRTCFEENRRGTKFAHCHTEKIMRWQKHPTRWRGQIACRPENIMCGRLWCDHMNEKAMFYGIVAHTTIPDHSGSWCDAIVADLGPKLRDPGMVPDGAGCGRGMACLNSSCVAAEYLNPFKDCDCDGHGVCNDLGNCHCDMGYAPPKCMKTGYGGSVDSGPPPTPLEKLVPMIVALVCLVILFLAAAASITYICIRYRRRLAAIKFQYSAVPTKSGGGDGANSTPAVQFKGANGAPPGEGKIKFKKTFGKRKKSSASEELRGPAPQPPPKPDGLKLNFAASATPEMPSPATPPLPPFPKVYADPAALENGHAVEDRSRAKPTVSSPIFQTSTNLGLDDLPTLGRRGGTVSPPPPPPPSYASQSPPPPPPSISSSQPPPPPPPSYSKPPLSSAKVTVPSSVSKTPSNPKPTASTAKAPSNVKTSSSVTKPPGSVSKQPSSVKPSPVPKPPASAAKPSVSAAKSSASTAKPSPVPKPPSSTAKPSPSAAKPSSVPKPPSSVTKPTSSVYKPSTSVPKPSVFAAKPSSVAKAAGAVKTTPSFSKTSKLPPLPSVVHSPPPPPPPSYTKPKASASNPPFPPPPSGGAKVPMPPPPPPPPANTKPSVRSGTTTSSYRRY